MVLAFVKDREYVVCLGDGGGLVQIVWLVSFQIDFDNWVVLDYKEGYWVGEREGERV